MLAAGWGMEYKYRLDKARRCSIPGSKPRPSSRVPCRTDGGPAGYAANLEKGAAAPGASGTLTAPVQRHPRLVLGNKTGDPVTVTLTASGFYTMSHEFRAKPRHQEQDVPVAGRVRPVFAWLELTAASVWLRESLSLLALPVSWPFTPSVWDSSQG